jgi:hypothetical protein
MTSRLREASTTNHKEMTLHPMITKQDIETIRQAANVLNGFHHGELAHQLAAIANLIYDDYGYHNTRDETRDETTAQP